MLGAGSHHLLSVCGNSPLSALCSATVFQVPSDFVSLCIQKLSDVFFTTKPSDNNMGEEKLRQTEMVYGVKILVKKNIDIFGKTILMLIYHLYCVCL